MPRKKELTKEEKKLGKLVDSFKASKKQKGQITSWTDSFLLKTRDRFRKASRTTRGSWTFDFYEILQNLNKESIKRELNPATD